MQPTELVAIMAAIIYSGRREASGPHAETRQTAVEEAWHIWHLAMDEWSVRVRAAWTGTRCSRDAATRTR
jgi:hypothetical protein